MSLARTVGMATTSWGEARVLRDVSPRHFILLPKKARGPATVAGPSSFLLCLLLRRAERLARRRVEEHLGVGLAKVEHPGEGSGHGVERTVDPPEVPVVLDEPDDRGQVGKRVVDLALLGEGRDHDQG